MNIKSNSKRKWGVFSGLAALVIVAASVLWLGLPVLAAPATSVDVHGDQTLDTSNPYLCGNVAVSTGTLDGSTCTAQFDASTGTLILHGYAGGSIRVAAGDLTIVLIGTNTINTSGYTINGLRNADGGDITITSSTGGSLAVNVVADGWGYGIYSSTSGGEAVRGDITIKGDASVSVDAKASNFMAVGVVGKNISVLEDASLSIVTDALLGSNNALGMSASNDININTTGDVYIDADSSQSSGISKAVSAEGDFNLIKVGVITLLFIDGSIGAISPAPTYDTSLFSVVTTASGETYTYNSSGTALTGIATIDNTAPKIGDTLTASLGSTNNSGTLSYQWKVGGSNAGTGSTYTVQTADLGKTITVTIFSSVETGSVVSAATSAVVKKDAAQPPVPTLDTKTYNSITLVGTAGHEYSKDNGSTWQSSPIFTGLNANTGYNLVQRALETADTYLSIASAPLVVTTDVMPPNALTGTVSISKTAPKVGDILTATTATNNTGTISYQWKVGGVNAGIGAVYEVQSADVGKTITVTVTSNVETGAVMSAATSAVTDYTYTIISGDNGTWAKGTGSGYVFVVDGPYSEFIDVVVDGATLTLGTDYTVAEGSTIVTLGAAFLGSLAAGEHNISFYFAQADGVGGKFNVRAVRDVTNPRTSDMNLVSIIASTLITGISMILVVIKLKRVQGGPKI